jgi:tetratricopeptide (TPR) repeat protein
MFLNAIRLILPVILISGLVGCAATENALVSVKNYAQGEFYLENESYNDCTRQFAGEIAKRRDNAKAHYYLGRCRLALDESRSALASLQKAVALDQGNPDYHFWQGVAYAANGQPQLERQSYQEALVIKPDHVQALVYLGHNRFDARRYRSALGYYNRALKQDPAIAAALYNRALALRKLQRTPEEINAWIAYLDRYPNGAFARRAATYLNLYGRFDYRNHTIGKRTLTLAQVRFKPSSAQIRKESFPALKNLARVTARSPELVLHVLAYQKNNRKLAEMRAKSVKKYLLAQESRIDGARIKVSWFDQPESAKIGKQINRLDSSINFFGQTG